MFRYFGYGSNLRRESLRAKGVEARHAEPAVLEGWRLVFNIAHPFRMEGKVASIVPDAAGAVHGALLTCDDAYLAPLDRHEGIGVFYERRPVTVRTYAGETHEAFVYVGLPGRTGEEGLPSRRYRNILARGADAVGLAPAYCAWLARLPVQPAPAYRAFEPPTAPGEEFTWSVLRARPLHTALLGHVFDMTAADEAHVILRALIEGIDATAFLLRRMDSDPGVHPPADGSPANLNAAQRRHLNACLYEFAAAYRYAGRLAPREPGADWS